MLAKSYNDPSEKLRFLEWKRGPNGLEGHRNGRVYFSVVKGLRGWMLHRYSERNGAIVFKSKEAVSSQAGGKAYAETLARLSNFSPLPSSPRGDAA